ncbi:S-adenosyl-L-methionine-dependent methyltransferase [Aspergillus japonicus CBS 114.51]|uniref:S-adenosyl-L-methionine-dependent methyltransferase n=1 Tax=Aspergillus japonicus CBS 114.51 TaxID=1448312 RepID=A0A8T8WLG0_ASPJA|nr:S-adenosyl-L-methionine-dependent methyltransferase [Aspergillus japonicus CBS 114.51]RAH76616.1 S-adenosyl-L-methionine-dependent methyltransferase [Aspergillus japonicus CBS 114.51]
MPDCQSQGAFPPEGKGGKTSEAQAADSYYSNGSSFMEWAWGTSFHVCRRYPGESMQQAMIRHEHYLALRLGLQPDQKVLDLGSGLGGPAREIARFAEVDVCGVEISAAQVQRATRLTEQAGQADRVRFVARDFTATHLENDSFDRAYSIEATCYASDLAAVYGEVFRLLKPGGILAVYELAMTDRYHATRADHRACHQDLERVAGCPHLRTTAEVVDAMRAVGFELCAAEDLADAAAAGLLPWYQLIDGSFKWMGGAVETLAGGLVAAFLRLFSSRWGGRFLRVGEMFGVLDPGSRSRVMDMVRVMNAYRIAGEKKLVTPMFLMVARKPKLGPMSSE